MNCKYLKFKLNKRLECKKKKCTISFKDCANCTFREYKNTIKSGLTWKSLYKGGQLISSRTSKLSIMERKRESLFTDDLEHCIICGKPRDHLHEVYFGKNRVRSIKEKMVIPICFLDHKKIHNDIELDLKYKKIGQKLFEKNNSREEFIKIFGRNYL